MTETDFSRYLDVVKRNIEQQKKYHELDRVDEIVAAAAHFTRKEVQRRSGGSYLNYDELKAYVKSVMTGSPVEPYEEPKALEVDFNEPLTLNGTHLSNEELNDFVKAHNLTIVQMDGIFFKGVIAGKILSFDAKEIVYVSFRRASLKNVIVKVETTHQLRVLNAKYRIGALSDMNIWTEKIDETQAPSTLPFGKFSLN